MQKSLMLQTISNWFKRNFSDPEALGLFFFIVTTLLLFEFFGDLLMPVFISVVIAYLLNSPVRWLERLHLPHKSAVWIVYAVFLSLFFVALLALLPKLWRQLSNLIIELPIAFSRGQHWLNDFTENYPAIFTSDSINHIATLLKQQLVKVGQHLLSYSLSGIRGLLEMVVYLVLVPLLVFFFLQDGKAIATWLARYLPDNRGMISSVWSEVHQKIGAYIRSRVVEMLIVALISVVTFTLLGMQYAFLIGICVGLSVIVPYIGAILVTVPIFVIGLMQWGLSAHFTYLLIAYAVIVTVDANVLFPVLFSETMDLHPIVIILAVLIFGGFWGFWGVFFAIPLAALVKAILMAWPQNQIDRMT